MQPICDRIDTSVKPCVHYRGDGLCNLRTQFKCIEYTRRNEPNLSYSQMAEWSRCKRKWYYSHLVGLELIELPVPLQRGRLASDTLDLIHGGDPHPLVAIRAAYSPEQESDRVEVELGRLEGLFSWYIESPFGEIRGKTQYPFEWSMSDYPRLTGYVDMVYPTTEPTMGYEFKYTENPSNYTKLNVNDQLSAYFLGNKNLERITLRLIQVPTIRPTKSESQSQYVERVYGECKKKKPVIDRHYWRSEFDLEAFAEKARWIAKEIVEACDRGMNGCYQNLNACYAPGECEYLPVCEAGGAISETIYKYKDEKEKDI